MVRNIQAMIDHFWTISSHSISELPLIKKAIAHANGIPKPTYPKYKVGGWITKAGSCSTGFMSAPLDGGTGKIVWNGLDVNNKKSKNPTIIKDSTPTASDFKGLLWLI